MAKIMPHVRHYGRAYPDVNEPYAHCRCASEERLIFYNITRCYGKRVTVFAVAIAADDIIKYQSFVYGRFVWEINVRYNKGLYVTFKLAPDLKKNTRYLLSYSPLNEGHVSILANSMLRTYTSDIDERIILR